MSSEDALYQSVPQEDPLIGTVLQERYRVIRKLGEGGFGAVYEGEHELIKRRVAIKCLHRELAQNPEVIARFHREALAATSIGHEHIIEVTDMGRSPEGAVFMVLEFLEGQDWSKQLENEGPQPLGKVVHIVSQIADALQAAHDKGIIHRDLKPENVFLVSRGGDNHFVKVLDFGISKFKDLSESTGGGMTKTGSTMGTPYYLPPEQAQGKKDLDHRADIYALGVMIFEALTGQYPFDGETYPELVLKICTQPPPPLSQLRTDLPPEVEQVVTRMLEKDPEDRFPDCASVKKALAPFREDYSKPMVAEDPGGAGSLHAASGVVSPARSGVQAARPPAQPMGSDASAATEVVPARKKGPMLMMVAALAVLIVGGGGLAAAMGWLGGTPAAPEGEEEGAEGSAGGEGTAEGAESDDDAAEEAGDDDASDDLPSGLAFPGEGEGRVNVKITTEPRDSELYLDGHRIPNPFDGELPKTTEPRRLEVKKDGYENVMQDLVLQFPQRVRIELERGSGTLDKRSAALKRRERRESKQRSGSATGPGRDGRGGSGASNRGTEQASSKGSGSAKGTKEPDDEASADKEPARGEATDSDGQGGASDEGSSGELKRINL